MRCIVYLSGDNRVGHLDFISKLLIHIEQRASFRKTLGDIVVGEEDFAWWNGDYIATIDPYGSQDTYYTWDPDADGWFEADPDSGAPIADKPAGDIEFEDYTQPMKRTVSDNSLSNSRGEGKSELKFGGKSKGKLWPFIKKNKVLMTGPSVI